MGGNHGEVIWPTLVANKILKKRLGSHNFVADTPTNNTIPLYAQSSSLTNAFYNPKPIQTYKVFVSTWNVGGVAPNQDLDMEDWVDSSCDIYVFGFQEVVPLKASNVFGSENREICGGWNRVMRECLKKKVKQNFECIISKQMVGIMISIWVRSDLHPFIGYPSVCCIGCGIMSCLGNKGSVSVRFGLHETSFCFVCTHLASGGKEGDEKNRNENVRDILCRTTFPNGPSLHFPKKILHHDRVILLGDLNYRISLPEASIRSLVEKKDWDTLLQNDQLKMEMMNGKVLEGWEEGNIKFGPTYKYYPNSEAYYGGVHGLKAQKRRAPAWCDRIIWNGKGIKQVSYDRGESMLSDHRPVMAMFMIEVESSTNLKTLRSLFLSNRFEHLNNSNTPFVEADEDEDGDEIFSTVGFVCKTKSTFESHF
ncbi:type IV inositol polyphosphate 5-phosphatase 9-like isoform X1 [Cucurbita moschata]|uniref:Type IV inositol polyphosphate 5-phosphatase 9-like isoform X1 n=1 Tax=Cucurbita moschata TaxID=3662 RepID=A0A6J1GQV7_CUCMO|nr:type IV inositol polyphosphate 5-phosphatase 9-like isoform X1 [Cucurbita moschata]XP_022954348.1 type IV inositol polyphosphate 5-phosphatase 9-like isoform X1 [Cucurbita moschata]